MSSSEDESDFQGDDSGSDGFEASPPKKSAPKPKAKVVSAPKAKVAAKPKATTKAPAKKILQEHHSNGTDSDDDVRMAMASEDDDVPAMAGPSKTAAKGKKTASETYTKLSQLEHILKRPDTYIGSVESLTAPMWVYDQEAKGLAYRTISYVPGLYKIVDEILVNAADNKVRDDSMSNLKVVVDREAKTISVYNDGAGIPVEMHSAEKVWIPELIFGHLLTSSNYDDEEAKVTGGRNGYGAKLANIYSTEFIVETSCSKSMKKYKQVFSNNMSVKGKPKIVDLKKEEDWTKITFTPDLARFGMTEFDDDLVSLIYKRVYDMAGITKGVKVFLNEKKVTVNSFKAYVGLYVAGTNHLAGVAKKNTSGSGGVGVDILEGDEAPKALIIHEKFGPRWEIAFAVSDGQFQQVSYCNAIATTKGGAHVNYIADQIVAGVAALVKKKNKGAPVKPHQIKSHLSLFVNCLIDNPSFDSQTKENMTLTAKKFGSTCILTEDFLKKIAKSGVIENILSFANFKAGEMLKKTDGKKRTRVTGLVKLEDANMAGGKESNKCTLILTEGDSAKALVVSGFGAGLNRDYYGVYPLRGKLLNVRDANLKALKDNAEIVAVKQIMGLQQDKKYEKTDSLRYGSIMIMADQDHDGSHIKGLIINFLDFWFPTLLKIPGFLVEFITPIVKVTKGKKSLSFFTIPQYELWKEETDNGRGWDIKYYKGLGTSTAKDAAVYFNALSTHKLPFQICSDGDRELIDKAFNKKRADDRKTWLAEADPDAYMDHAVKSIPIADFVNKELILFSIADCVRSIPSVVDGFKPGQRKVLFGCFLKKMQKEVKVAQLSGFIGEKSAYHHGEVSLQGTIIGLAQTYLGSNNINLLLPNGQFGTRLQGGKDAASARYIFTNLHPLARILFQASDDNVLSYLNDDGYSIEPKWYVPILPMVLVNGSDGIGTGWSSTIPSYNPADMVDNLKRRMADEDLVPMHPWYRGFKGTIEKIEKDGYKVTGVITQLDEETVEITELPIRQWTQSYKETLEAWVIGSDKTPALVKDYKEYHTDRTVHFIITLTDKGKAAVAREGLEKTFKLTGKLNTSNMVCFDPAGKIKKYTTTEEILLEFYDVRMEYYHKRKAFLVAQIGDVHRKLTNQARFIKMIIDDKLKISKKKRSAIVKELIDLKFDRYPKARKTGVDVAAEEIDEDDDGAEGSDSDYDYLLSMSLSSLTAEKVAKLLEETLKKEAELTALLKLSAQDLWVRDLDTFTEKWEEALEEDVAAAEASRKAGGGKGKGKAKKRAASSDDDDVMDEEFDYKPVKKIRAPIVKKKSVPLPDTDDEAVAVPIKVVAKVIAKPVIVAKPVVKKKRASSTFSGEDDEIISAPKIVKKKPKVVISDDDDDMEEDIYAQPSVWPPQPSPKVKVKVGASKPVVAKVIKPKARAITISDSDEDLEEQVKKVPVKKSVLPAVSKPKAAPKRAVLSEDEDDIYDVSIIAPKPRRVAVSKKAAYVDLDLDSDEAEANPADDSESAFEDSD